MNRYRLCKKLTDAQFGPVLLCRDTQQTNQLVAVKHVRVPRRGSSSRGPSGGAPPHPDGEPNLPSPKCDDPWLEKSMVELLHKTGGHKHVLQYHQVLEDRINDKLVFVMDFCAGGDLHDRLLCSKHSRLGEVQALEMLQQITRGLVFLHRNGIAHRDLSLENILLSAEGVCKISDFGLSALADQKCNDTVGKCYYMAPEVAAGEVYCPKAADVWSLGIILFILLTGSPLCQLASRDEVTLKVLANHGVEQILELWGIKWMFSEPTLCLLNDLLRICPEERIKTEQIPSHAAFACLDKPSSNSIVI